MLKFLISVLVVSLAAVSAASAVTVSVSGQAGPWSQSANPSLDYGVHDNLGPTVLTVVGGNAVTITYMNGLTDAFGVAPIVDANGFVNSGLGSGPDTASLGFGFSTKPFPSFYIDPLNAGPGDIWLNELIGAFADNTGAVIGKPFAVGNGPLNIIAPGSATLLLLGVNDDIYADNLGALNISVEGDGVQVAATPLPAALPLFATGLGALGLLGWRRKRKAQAAA